MTDQFSEFEFVNGVADAAVLLESKTARFKRESDEIDRVANYVNYSRIPPQNPNNYHEQKYEPKQRNIFPVEQELKLELENAEVENVKQKEEENLVEITEIENVNESVNMKIPECPNSHSEGRTLINTVFPTDVDSLFTWLFTDSKFFNELHKSRKTFDMLQSDWPEAPEGSHKTRKITFTITLTQAVGPKTSTITETQVMHAVSRPGQIYVVEVDSVNAKPTPYADAFSIFSHFCMTRISATETKLVVVNQVKFLKSVSFVVKPFIEKSSWAGLEDFYTCLEKALRLECSKMSMSRSSSLKKLSLNSSAHLRLRRMNADANGRRKPKISRTKRPAPEPPTPSPSPNSNSTPNRRQRFFFSFSQKTGSGSGSSGISMKHIKTALLVVILALICLNIFLYLKLQRLEAMRNSAQFQSNFDQGYEIQDERVAFQWLTEKLEKAEMNYREQLDKWKKAIETTAQSFHKWDEEQKTLELDLTSYAKDEGKSSRWVDWE